MFTGIIESLARVAAIRHEGSNVHFTITSTLAPELRIDQSVAHNGVCLTVVAIDGNNYVVTAVAETLAKTNLGTWQVGDEINIERSLKIGDRLDGHFVQGHVDATATCIEKQALEGSWLFRFRFPAAFAALIIEKGSVCINGVSLTVFNAGKDEFTVTIIPYTHEHTNFHNIEEGTIVNIEFDVLGKYLLRRQELNVA
ncbi:MAG: riboflavin synthase [Taibaiella sp.]|nr:riboflavin synthase [Taibaiella sp.]